MTGRTRKIGTITAAAVVAVGMFGSFSHADKPKVAVVAAATNTANAQTEPRFTDVRDKLLATGLFESVGVINVTGIGDGIGTPPLSMLQEYDAIITWSNVNYADPVTMGDVLADYVDAGGGVVVAVFANTSPNASRYLQGRWQLGDYIAIPQTGGHTEGPGELGAVLVPDHPIMEGVTTFVTKWGINGLGQVFGGYKPVNTTLTSGSVKIAQWNTGHTLIALTPNPRVVELGFHPVSSDVNNNAYWDVTTDGDLIMANALRFVIGEPGPVCDGDIGGDGSVGVPDLLAVINSWGVCPPKPATCDADIAPDGGDGNVGVPDLLAVINNWGECE